MEAGQFEVEGIDGSSTVMWTKQRCTRSMKDIVTEQVQTHISTASYMNMVPII